jgi:hypothetical protein
MVTIKLKKLIDYLAHGKTDSYKTFVTTLVIMLVHAVAYQGMPKSLPFSTVVTPASTVGHFTPTPLHLWACFILSCNM